MKIRLLSALLLLMCAAGWGTAHAQLSSNPHKFLGNITTSGSVNGGGIEYKTLWNQITPENESKWQSIEGTARGTFRWSGCDNAYNYAKNNGLAFKFHTLIWGSQYPSWMDNLSTEDQYDAIIEWYDAVKKRYPDLQMIDVVNEAVAGHAPAPYKEALGGDGKTGYDWIIKAFELAHERWPDAILIYNDYNTFQWQRSQFINLVKTLIDAGAPIDAYGCQSHDLTDLDAASFRSYMTEIHNALQIPMYSTEYDIGTTDDDLQLQRYQEQIPYMWEADYCAGITLWGYIYGRTWTTDGNSGLIRDGVDRPAMEWLREYMESDAAKTATFHDRFPFSDGHTKEASVYIKPATLAATIDEPLPVEVRARLKTKTIEKVDVYVNGGLYTTLTEAPYTFEYTPAKSGSYTLYAEVTATDGSVYERLSHFKAYPPRKPYKGTVTTLPGTLQAENFDSGAEGISYHDSDTQDEGGAGYRTDNGGVDIVSGGTGYAIGYTASGEWLEYTVNIEKPGIYSYKVYAASGSDNSGFKLSLSNDGVLTDITGNISIPNGGNWTSYSNVSGRLTCKLDSGTHVIRLTITGSYCNIDKIEFTHIETNPDITLDITADPDPAIAGQNALISVDAQTTSGTIKYVDIYVNDTRIVRKTAAPYQISYKFSTVGEYTIKAVATDTDGKESDVFTYILTVKKERKPYKNAIAIPGTLQAENFDSGDEGDSYHDSDSEDEGNVGYRTDNGGVDIVTGNGGYAIGYTQTDEWLEYTVNVETAGKYRFTAYASSGADNSAFIISRVNADGTITNLTSTINVPNGGDWSTYNPISGKTKSLEQGEQVFRITIKGSYCNIDKIVFTLSESTGIDSFQTGEARTYSIYTQAGIHLGEIIVSSDAQLDDKIMELTGRPGLFIVKEAENGKGRVVMVSD